MLNRLHQARSLLDSNPRLFFKLLSTRLRPPRSHWRKSRRGVLFDFDFSLGSLVRHMYIGEYEPATVRLMEEVLHPGDTFIDVGANIGYLSAIGAGLVGQTGQVHSFEPVPQYFQRLEKAARLNPDYRIVVNQCALGEIPGRANIDVTTRQNIGWNTMVPGFMREGTVKESLAVPVGRLDQYIAERSLTNISLIKIDTEGFEFPVLKGLSGFFETGQRLPLILCEVCPAACRLLGYTLEQVASYLAQYGYHARHLDDPGDYLGVSLDLTELEKTTNVVFTTSRQRP